MDNLIEKLNTRINELNNYQFDKEFDLRFLNKFYEHYNFNLKNITKMIYLRNAYFLVGIIVANKVRTFKEIHNLIKPLEHLIDELPTEKMFCEAFICVTDLLKEMNFEEFKKTECDIPPFDNDDFIKFILEIDNLDIFDCLILFLQIKEYCNDINLMPKKEQEACYKSLLIQLNQTDFYKKMRKLSFENTKKRINELNKMKKEETDKCQNLIKIYKKIISDLQANSIIDYKDYFDEVEEDIKYELLLEILKHNEHYYKKISNQVARLDNNLDIIFKINGFDINLLSKENQIRLINNGNISNIKEILPLLNDKPFLIDEQDNIFTEILLCSNKEILTNIKDLYEKDIIDINFIYHNYPILLSKNCQNLTNINCSFETFINNLSYLKAKQFNLKNIRKSNPTMFLMDESLLKQQLLLLNEYGINFNNQENIDYSYITNNKIFNIIDQFIELGLHDYVKDNLEILVKNSDEIIKRIYIANVIDLNIWNENHKIKNSIMTGYNFPIKNEDLDNYIINTTNNYVDNNLVLYFNNSQYEYSTLINTLDNNFLNDENYLFDDIIISRNKVIRNISSISSNIEINEENIKDVLLTSIIYNSILDNDQIETIKNELNFLLDKKFKKLSLQ